MIMSTGISFNIFWINVVFLLGSGGSLLVSLLSIILS